MTETKSATLACSMDENIRDIVHEVVEENEELVAHIKYGYKDLKYSTLNILVAKVKDRMDGQTSPSEIKQLIKEEIDE